MSDEEQQAAFIGELKELDFRHEEQVIALVERYQKEFELSLLQLRWLVVRHMLTEWTEFWNLFIERWLRSVKPLRWKGGPKQ